MALQVEVEVEVAGGVALAYEKHEAMSVAQGPGRNVHPSYCEEAVRRLGSIEDVVLSSLCSHGDDSR